MVRYTAVFEWPDGEQPRVGVFSSWLGGKICAVAFEDCFGLVEDVDEAEVAPHTDEGGGK